MNLKIFFALFGVIFSVALKAQSTQQQVDKLAFYKALASNDEQQVTAQLEAVSKSASPEKNAYEGTLLMRKAGMVKSLSNKLSMFKSGRLKLEKAITEDEINTEYRFLRLMIQENVPGILNYKSDIKKDSQHIKESFKSQPPAIQKVIADYSKNSKILRSEDFKL